MATTPTMTRVRNRDSKHLSITLRGRVFSKSDLDLIAECVATFFKAGRTRISIEVCKKLKWQQPNGWPKDRACRDVLSRLEALGRLKLPPRVRTTNVKQRPVRKDRKQRFVYKPVVFPKDITLHFAKGNRAEREWNKLVASHHYLGHKIVVGRCIKYLVKRRDETVGAISFSSCAWKVHSRDQVLRAMGFSAASIRECVISNSRFLIITDKTEPNLASRILSAAVRQVTHDWEEFYSVKPEVIETFVEPLRFKGTCYRAANWLYIGRTKGYKKSGNTHRNSQQSKLIFLYPLSATLRKQIIDNIEA